MVETDLSMTGMICCSGTETGWRHAITASALRLWMGGVIQSAYIMRFRDKVWYGNSIKVMTTYECSGKVKKDACAMLMRRSAHCCALHELVTELGQWVAGSLCPFSRYRCIAEVFYKGAPLNKAHFIRTYFTVAYTVVPLHMWLSCLHRAFAITLLYAFACRCWPNVKASAYFRYYEYCNKIKHHLHRVFTRKSLLWCLKR